MELSKLPTDILYLIREYCEEPVYRIKSAFSPYMDPTYLLRNPLAISYIAERLEYLGQDGMVEKSGPDIPFTTTRHNGLLHAILTCSSNKNPRVVDLLKPYVVKHTRELKVRFMLSDIIHNMMENSDSSQLEWIKDNYPLEFRLHRDLILDKLSYEYISTYLHNHKSLPYITFYNFLTKGSKEDVMRYFSELKREPTEMSYVMYASSPYVVDILRLMNKTLPNRALSNLVQNPGKGVLTYLLENYSERLLDQELQDALCLNSSDEVVDYMSSILYPIPYGNMSRIKNRCQNLLMNKNPSVENIAVDYLNAFLQEIGRTIRYHHEAEFAPIRESLGATWSASLLPRVLKMLEENPEYIVWYFLSLNPSDIAIQILKKNLNNIVIQQFVKNKNKEMISVIEEYITTYDSSLNGGWHNWTVIDELFTNEGVVEIDHTETKRRVTEWVKELLRTGY